MKAQLDWQLVEKYYNNYHFFYNGPFSNWLPSSFVCNNSLLEPLSFNGDRVIPELNSKMSIHKGIPAHIKFNCSEQAMMYYKATFFDDTETAFKILSAKHPSEQKSLGRQVKNFDVELWNTKARNIVYDCCLLKFKQNPDLFEALMATDGMLLVEASPTDKIWGIGRGGYEEDLNDVKTWKGSNWLGEVLTRLRENLKDKLNSNPY